MEEITTLDQLEARLASSGAAPLLLFKHSTRCPISADAYVRVERFLSARTAPAPPVFLIKVIESRPVSNAIADRLGVPHKSPQILLVKDGRAVWTASHHGIQPDRIREAIAEHAT